MVNITAEDLNLGLYNALRWGVFRNLGGSMGNRKPYDLRRLDDGKVFTRLVGMEQTMWFNGVGDERIFSLSAHFGENATDQYASVQHAIVTRVGELTDVRRRVFDKTFADYNVRVAGEGFEEFPAGDILVRAVVGELPLGESGAVAGKLNDYAYNIFSVPTRLVQLGENPSGKRWHVLSRPQPIDIRK